MTILKRSSLMALGLSALIGAGGLPLVAQEPAPKAATPPAKKKQEPSRRVPAYFGQIGLTTEQRASIYGIQGKRIDKIESLEKQIAAEKSEMISECEAVLNETQKKLLDNLRKAASEPTPKAINAASTRPVESSKSSN